MVPLGACPTRTLEETEMPVLDYMSQFGYEQLTMVTDPAVGLKAIIVIHAGPGHEL